MFDAAQSVKRARAAGEVIPSYNVPYPEMVEPVIRAIADEDSIGMVMVARIEWEKFGAISPETIAMEYHRYKDAGHTLLHLDHIPVIDEDGKLFDYMPVMERAIDCGYQSVMIDASRLPLKENEEATRKVCELAHSAGIPCEAELGRVSGHESGPALPYEEIFSKRIGFTDVAEAGEFASVTGCDWLSVAAGSVHGAVAENLKFAKKPEARLDIEHIAMLYASAGIPLVLHGGSGIKQDCITAAIRAGIAKINIGTEIRQSYLKALEQGADARSAVYENVREIISQKLCITGLKTKLFG